MSILIAFSPLITTRSGTESLGGGGGKSSKCSCCSSIRSIGGGFGAFGSFIFTNSTLRSSGLNSNLPSCCSIGLSSFSPLPSRSSTLLSLPSSILSAMLGGAIPNLSPKKISSISLRPSRMNSGLS